MSININTTTTINNSIADIVGDYTLDGVRTILVRTTRPVYGMWDHSKAVRPLIGFDVRPMSGLISIVNRGRVPYVNDVLDAIDAAAELGAIQLIDSVIDRAYGRANIGTFGKGWGAKFGAYYGRIEVLLNNDGYRTKIHVPTLERVTYTPYTISILYGILKRLEEETAD